MATTKEGYFITKEAKRNFRIWLIDKNLTVNKFAKNCGVSRQYIESVLNGKIKITSTVLAHFRKGGYECL